MAERITDENQTEETDDRKHDGSGFQSIPGNFSKRLRESHRDTQRRGVRQLP